MSLEYNLEHDEMLITRALVLMQRAVVLSCLLGDTEREAKYMDVLTELEKLEKKYNINYNVVRLADQELDDEGLSTNEILDRADKVCMVAI